MTASPAKPKRGGGTKSSANHTTNKIEFKVYLDPDESEQLKAFCAARLVSVSGYIRQIVTRQMKREMERAMDRAQEKARLAQVDQALARLDNP